MKQFDINVKPRTETGKGAAHEARRQGLVPAIVYGAGEPNVAVTVEEKALRSALRAGAAKSVVNLSFEGENRGTLAIIKETQYDPLGEEINHVDFYRITADKLIHLTVPLVTQGRAQGESLGGILEHLTREVRVETLPMNIPEAVVVDITLMGVGDTIHLRDLPVIAGVKYLDAPDAALIVLKSSRMARAEAKPAEEAEVAAAAATEGEAAEKGEKAEAPEKAEKPAKGKKK